MFLDPDIAAVFCARGGYGTLRLLERMDFAMIRENPKILLGYSDVTALLLAVYRKSSLVTFHGPMVRELGTKSRSMWDGLLRLLTGHELALRFPEGTCLRQGKAVGTLIGGNLSLICHLLGTPFLPSLEGRILFVEELGEPLYRLDRMITHLRLSGQLRGLAGFAAGQFQQCGEQERIDSLLMERLGDLGIPLALGLPVGHGSRNVALPIGVRAELDTQGMILRVREPCVERIEP
jgi:muramoyltetrapeptide carboxypeptidase